MQPVLTRAPTPGYGGITPSAPPVIFDDFAQSIVDVLSDGGIQQVAAWMYGGAEQLALRDESGIVSLALRDLANPASRWKATASGLTVSAASGILNSEPGVDFPALGTRRMEIPFVFPEVYSFAAVFRMPAVTAAEDRVIFSTLLGVSPLLRINSSNVIVWNNGGSTFNTNATSKPVGTDCLLWGSYAADQTAKTAINAVTASSSGSMLPPLQGRFLDLGGYRLDQAGTRSLNSKLAFFQMLPAAMHGSSALDTLRGQWLNAIAAGYGITVGG